MNIQNNLSSTNFQAKRSMIIKSLKNKETPVFEVFRLSSKDAYFVKNYINTIDQKEYTLKQKNSIISFLKKFLNEISTHKRNQDDYYIGVNNGKNLAGFFSIDRGYNNILSIKDIFFTKTNDIFSRDATLKFLIKTARAIHPKPIYGINKANNTLESGKDLLRMDEFTEKENIIKNKYPELIFKTINTRRNNEIHLRQILD